MALRIFMAAAMLLFSITAQAFLQQKPEFLPAEQAFVFQLQQEQGSLSLSWDIAPGYYLYRHSISVQDATQTQLQLELPHGLENEDEFFGLTQIYYHSLHIPLSGEPNYPLTITWQGCADAGLCYPPQSVQINAESLASGALAQDQSIARQLAESGLLLNLAAFFAMGLLLAFTPCMLPMVPILSAVIAGSKPGGWQGARLGAVFVLAMSLVYAALGVVAASLGSNLAAALQNPWLLLPFAGLFVLLAMAQFGLFIIRMPAFISDRLHSTDQKVQGGSVLGAAALGVLSALLVGPCMTAPLAGALLYISQSGDALSGGLALFVLGLGSGLPLLLAMSFGMRWLPKPGQWMQVINRLFGYAMLAAAIFVIRGVIPPALTLALWAALLLAIAVQLSFSQRPGWQVLQRFVAVLLGIWSAIMLLGAASGGSDPWQPLRHWQSAAVADNSLLVQRSTQPQQIRQQMSQAQAAGQWVILDFYADWCVSCKVMERTVFGQPQVQAAIEDMVFLQPDVTANTPAQQQLLKDYGIIGPPTILFINPRGEEIRSARITGEVNAREFLQYLQLARAKE